MYVIKVVALRPSSVLTPDGLPSCNPTSKQGIRSHSAPKCRHGYEAEWGRALVGRKC